MAKIKVPFKYDTGGNGWDVVKKNAPKGSSNSAVAIPTAHKLSQTKSMLAGAGKKITFSHTIPCGEYVDITLNFQAVRRFSNDDSNPKVGKFFWFESIKVWATKVDPYIGYTINAKAHQSGFFHQWKGDIYAPAAYIQIKWEAAHVVKKTFKPSRVYDFKIFSASATGKCTFSPKY